MTSNATFWMRRLTILLAALCLGAAALAQESDQHRGAQLPGGWGFYPATQHDPARPTVLLMGDSILSGYRSVVIARLQGKANVDLFINPLHQASPELYPKLDEVFAKGGPYAVIHFNMGLHGWDKGRIPEGQFEPLTAKLVSYLKTHAPDAKLIWASTTPVTEKGHPGSLDPKINSNIVEQNRLAAKVMAQAGVPVDNLYDLMIAHLELARGDQFHWVPAGSRLQGEAVADRILARLGSPPAARQP